MEAIAVVGDRETVLGFRALGLDVYTPETPDEARNVVDRLAKEETAIIYITEALAAEIAGTIARYDSAMRPAIILIPDTKAELGLGKEAIDRRVEKAVGTNILKQA